MQSSSILSVLAIGLAVSATASDGHADDGHVDGHAVVAPAGAPAPAPLDRSWLDGLWSGDLSAASRWIALTLPTFDELTDPAGWSARWLVSLRDVAAAATGSALAESRELLAMIPATLWTDCPIPDLTILSASPVPGVESSGFGWRRDPIHHHDKFHKGTDFRADRGTPVYAAGAGVIAFTGSQTGYGNVIYVDHGGGVVTRYAHLSRIEVKAGAAVPAARLIGRVGATGRATGPHLHVEIRLEGRAVDPELAMQVGSLQRTDPATARWTAWLLAPAAQAERFDRHDPPSRMSRKPRADRTRAAADQRRPERRHAPTRDRDRDRS